MSDVAVVSLWGLCQEVKHLHGAYGVAHKNNFPTADTFVVDLIDHGEDVFLSNIARVEVQVLISIKISIKLEIFPWVPGTSDATNLDIEALLLEQSGNDILALVIPIECK